MDYARKIGKSDEHKKWSKHLLRPLTTHDYCIDNTEPSSGDNRLTNWRKWLEDRKKQYERIKSSTGRHQTDQAMNACEKIRPFIEMRDLMDYATVPVPVVPDKFRGGPEFWRTPRILPNRGDPCLPDVAFTPSKKELNALPELTYVALPELIEKEKDLVGLKSKKPLWKRSQYLAKRRNQLSKEIELLVPKEPETKHLVIEGHAPRRKKEEPRIPPITISDTEEDRDCDLRSSVDQVIVLRIQDREIVWRRSAFESEQTDPITWNLFFSTQVKRRVEKEIVFENKGNRVIVYEWRDAAFRSKTIPLKRRISPFFFNKTKETIPPGQIVKLKVWYKPGIPGVFREFWRLKTDPELCPSPLIFRLSGCAEATGVPDPVLMVHEYLDRCIRDATIREIIDGIVEDMSCVKPLEPFYGSLFLESEIFVKKNPLCFYYPSLLTEFHKMYYSATNQKEERWNLCLDDLRETLLKIKQPERRHAMLLQFSQFYKECLKPTLSITVQCSKHEMVYSLLCSFLNRFELESEYAKNACFVKEFKEVVVTFSEISSVKSINGSQVSVKTSNLRGKRRRRSITRTQSALVHETVENAGVVTNNRPYKEIFFIRIHELLKATIEQVLASIESFNTLNERDK